MDIDALVQFGLLNRGRIEEEDLGCSTSSTTNRVLFCRSFAGRKKRRFSPPF